MIRTWLTLTVMVSVSGAASADWPMVRGDAARSGGTGEALSAELVPVWTYRPQHPPEPAWPREERMIFDRAFQVTAADGTLFFGSSSEGTVTALEAGTGEVRWTYTTDAPVRFAPAVWKDRVFAVSDDGHLYALAIRDGSLIQKWRGGPEGDLALGNGRIVSRHPARGAPVIRDDVVYYAAGIWQSEGISLSAIDAASGAVRWVNDSAGSIYMPQPHGGANAESGVTVQGYVVATEKQLFVPTGRAVPAAFNRADGEFQYYHLQKFGKQGGSDVMAAGEEVFNIGADYSGTIFEATTGESVARLKAGAYAALSDGVLHADGTTLQFLKRTVGKGVDRRGEPVPAVSYKPEWKVDGVPGGTSLIVAGKTAVSAGKGELATVDLDSRKTVWSAQFDGRAYGLAVSEGRLFVSTDDGAIHCFAPSGGPHRFRGRPAADAKVRPDGPPLDAKVITAAEAILEKSGITEGYCVDLGCGDGSLAAALAERSDLHIVAVDPDPENVALARQRLTAAGLHGPRVTVLQADLNATRLPKFVFNLVVSSRSLTGADDLLEGAEVERLQRPCGGVACLGPAEEMSVAVRGPLESAGNWTHQYTDPANTGSTQDEVKGPLRVLWYNDIALDLPQRHGRGPAPLFDDGRLFVLGMDELLAADAYNGRVLWRFELPGILHAFDADHLIGTSATGSQFCLSGGSVYVRHEGVAYRLDVATGKTLRKFTPPKQADGKRATWGYIACRDGILFGSGANREHVVRHGWRPADMSTQFTESRSLFAFDVETGKLLWQYDAEDSIRHNAIAVADGHVYLIDRPVAKGDLLENVDARRGKEEESFGHPTGKLVRLDARTGEVAWSNGEEVWGTMLAYSEPQDMLLMSYQSTRFKLPSEIGGRLAVFRGQDGYKLWDREAKYVTRPLILGESILAQGGKWDLQTGDELPFEFDRSYGCGQLAASKNLLLFRSATFGYVDLSREDESDKTQNFGGVRPGCWINALPVGGLVLLPDASAGCTCSYQNRSWMALQGSD